MIRKACENHDAALLVVSHDPQVLETFERQVALREINRAMGGRESEASRAPAQGGTR